jgi:O-antigen/teichoic acid export membrane protein
VSSVGAGTSRALTAAVLTGLGGQALLVVTGVLAARILGPEDRGYLAIVVLVPTVLAYVGTVGLPLAVTYDVARNPGSARHTLAITRRALAAQTAVLLLVQGVAVLLAALISDAHVASSFAIAALFVPGAIFGQYGLAVLQGLGRPYAFNALRVLPLAANTLGLVAAVAAGVRSLPAITAVWAVAYLASGGLTLVAAQRSAPPGGGTGEADLRPMLRFGVRGFIGSLSPTESFRVDQALVALLLAPVQLGYYVVGFAFTNLPRFVAQSIGLVAFPAIAAASERGLLGRRVLRYVTLYLALVVPVVVALEATAGILVPFFFGNEFEDAVPIARIGLVAAVLLGLRRLVADALRGAGKPGAGTVAEFATLAALVLAMPPLATAHGTVGAALAMTAAAAAGLVLVLAYLKPTAALARVRQAPSPDV